MQIYAAVIKIHIRKLEGTKYVVSQNTNQPPPSFLAEGLKVFDVIDDLVHEAVLLSHLRCESGPRQHQLIPGGRKSTKPRCSMFGIFTYIWVILRGNVGKYSIRGAYGRIQWLGLKGNRRARGSPEPVPLNILNQFSSFGFLANVPFDTIHWCCQN